MSHSTSTIAIFICVIFATLQTRATAQVIVGGPCPKNIQTIQDFNATSFLGRWYEYSKYQSIFEIHGKCSIAEYGQLPNDEISVLNTQISKVTNTTQKLEGTAQTSSSGRLAIRFCGFASLAGPTNYWILDTDYENYAAIYSCSNFLILHTRSLWILTREAEPTEETVKAAENAILRNGLSVDSLSKTEQKNC